MVSLMQNEDKTNNRKTMIMFSFDDFSTTLTLQARVECLFFGFLINLLHNSTLTLLNHGLI